MALVLANAAKDTYDFLGTPEGEIALAQLVVHMAAAPKSNAVYMAFKAAMKAAKETGSLMPPAHIRNAPTKLMKDLGYGKGYAYDHDAPEGFSGQNYFPDGMERAAVLPAARRGARGADQGAPRALGAPCGADKAAESQEPLFCRLARA